MKETITIIILLLLISCSPKETLTERYENGNLKAEIPLIEGKKSGLAKYYNEKGYIDMEVNFENDTPIGTLKTFDSNGKVQREFDFESKRGKVYRPDGNAYLVGTFDNKELLMNGIWEDWLIKDNYKRFEWTYVNDIENGPYKAFREDGSIEAEGFYKNGRLDSILTYYDENGNCVKKELWKSVGRISSLVKELDCGDKGSH
jgi:antitoxin component YwqK of YwqJK toxin-antitoxin module